MTRTPRTRNCRLWRAVAIAGVALERGASADEVGFPCPECVVIAEANAPPRPLVVLLHGDEGGPSRIVGAWRDVAKKKGLVLFAPRCPRALGCVGSYWQWDGDPKWLEDRVADVEAKYAVDPSRRYLAGWSGGSTYLTFHLERWFPTFAAVSVAGGGAPGHETCLAGAGGACAPVHYAMGDGNPLFGLAVRARDAARACGHDLAWTELHGADHEGEWRWYVSHTGDIADWLVARSDGCGVGVVAPTTSTVPPGASSSAPAFPPAPSDPSQGPATGVVGPRAPPSPCACDAPGRSCDGGARELGAFVLAVALRRNRRRPCHNRRPSGER